MKPNLAIARLRVVKDFEGNVLKKEIVEILKEDPNSYLEVLADVLRPRIIEAIQKDHCQTVMK